MAKILEKPISTVRSELFELFEDVIQRRVTKVVIAHRGIAEKAVLVSEAYIARLEALVAAMRPGAGPLPFALIGSATLVGSPEEVLVDVRAQQAALRAVKVAAL